MKLIASTVAAGSFLFLLTNPVQAQEADAFLACADITDRNARLACLDEALDNATRGQEATRDTVQQEVTQDEPAAVEEFGNTESAVAESAQGEQGAQEQTDDKSFFRLPRIGNIFRRDENESADTEAVAAESKAGGDGRLESFGRSPRVVINEDGEDELNDVVTELLMAKPNMWLIRLASGQVWRQVHPKRLNLREGDPVRIYPTGWGDNFRLETARLSGYIQVVRVE